MHGVSRLFYAQVFVLLKRQPNSCAHHGIVRLFLQPLALPAGKLLHMPRRSALQSLVPSALLDTIRRIQGTKIRFVGNFGSWEDAKAASTGYSAQVILDRTIEANRKVKRGEAAFERDSITYGEMEHNFPLAWALMRAAAKCGRLHVLDFGGAMGTTYFQSRALVNAAPHLKWAIVEQPSHVEAGINEFANKDLSFHPTIEDACKRQEIDVLILSGVLQYLPDPLLFLDSVLERRFRSIIVDRTPFMLAGRARLTVQHVPKWIYPASYPAWFFSDSEVLNKFSKQYEEVATWPALDKHHPEGGRAQYKGFLFELKKAS